MLDCINYESSPRNTMQDNTVIMKLEIQTENITNIYENSGALNG